MDYVIDEKITPNRSIFPSYGCLSFSEQALYVTEAVNEVTNTLFESIGIEELAVYESTGNEVVYEGAKLDELKEKIKKWGTNIWAAIKAAYEKVLEWFDQRRKESVKYLTKLSLSDLKYVKDDAKFGKVNDLSGYGKVAWKVKCQELCSDVNKDLDGVSKLDRGDAEEKIRAIKDKYNTKIYSELSGISDAKNLTDMTKFYKSKVLGNTVEVTKKYLQDKNMLGTMVGIVLEGADIKPIKESYNTEKRNIKTAVSDLCKIKDDAGALEANAKINLYKSIITATHNVAFANIDALRTQYTQYHAVLVKVYRSVKSGKKEAGVKVEESNTSFISTQMDLVDEAFEW
jgi:hypothetical protein